MVWFLIRLLLLVILFLLIRRLWRSLAGAVQSQGGWLPPRPDFSPQPLVYDPECGLHLPLGDALTVHTEKGMLYFCSRECRDVYLAKKKKNQE